MTAVDELFAFVELDDGDRARLRALEPRLAPAFAAIASRFYAAIAASPRTAAVLSDPAQIEPLRGALIDWMSSGLRGPHDAQFVGSRTRIGRRHVAVGLGSPYLFTAMTVIRLAYQDHVAALYPADEALAVMRSVHKLLDVELAIMVHHHELDTAARLVARERRAQADRILAMQTMTAGLAHEVRNPLNAAKLQLELVDRRLRRSHNDPRLAEPTALAQKEIIRLTALLNEFLMFARPPELHRQDHDVVTVVRQVVEAETATAEPRGVALALEAETEQMTAEVDVARLHEVVHNLVRNAIEAAPPGGHVGIAVRGDADQFQIRITDDGPGIPDEVRPRIYEPFFSTKEGGTGLGMSSVHSLVSLHGGAIGLETGPRGTVFEVAIPRRR